MDQKERKNIEKYVIIDKNHQKLDTILINSINMIKNHEKMFKNI